MKELVVPSKSPLPAQVAQTGARSARELDVRPVLAKGGDPFRLIMKVAGELADDEALELIAGFEPTPLYTVMRSMGRASYTEQHGDNFHVWFYRDFSLLPPKAEVGEAERGALQDPVELDVSEMEPPQPMIAILEKLVELGPGAQLLVAHHREPVLLYDKLELRGYKAKTTKRGEGDYLIHIAPAWAFDADKG